MKSDVPYRVVVLSDRDPGDEQPEPHKEELDSLTEEAGQAVDDLSL